jgi:nitrite reductase (NADH) small subunit
LRLVGLCKVDELPVDGALCAFQVEGREICVANDGGRYAAIDNICPHRGGPLAEGTLEAGRVLCPWHAWAFSLADGSAEHDPSSSVEVFPIEVQGNDVLIGVDTNEADRR